MDAHNLSAAPRGSKKGWPTFHGQTDPKVGEVFTVLYVERGLKQTDAVAEAIALWVRKNGGKVPRAAGTQPQQDAA